MTENSTPPDTQADEAQIYAPQGTTPQTLRDVITVRRVTFNYVVIATICLLLGIVIGAYSAFRVERESRSWLREAISEAFAAEAGTLAQYASAQAPSLDDPSSRFEIQAVSEYFQGGADAPVEIIEFGDFNCGFCARFHAETLPQILDSYGDHIRYVYRDYPILANSSATAALAARCAGEQGAYWEYHNMLYTRQGEFGQTGAFSQFAAELDLDTEAFNACMDDQSLLTLVADDYREAQSFGIRGTPAFFINGRPVSGAQAFSVFASIINEELQVAGVDAEVLVPADSLLPEGLLPAS